jgi:DNA polymerase-3 subunit delta
LTAWKAAYLIHGDDHGRVAERRGRLRVMAEAESGAGGVEVFEGEGTAEQVALALSSMTFAVGRRFLIVDGVERYKDADVAVLAPALRSIAPETTVAFFGRDEGRFKTPAGLAKAVRAAGGDVSSEQVLKPKELPKWVTGQAAALGLQLDSTAARSLVAQVGERQQRLLRELEKLAIAHGPGAKLGVEEIYAAAARSAERQVWGLVDALVARNGPAALRSLLQLRAQGEDIARLVPLMARRLRDLLVIAARLEAGESPAQIKADAKQPGWAFDLRLEEARRTDSQTLREALEALAELELDSRGNSELDGDTSAVRAVRAIA